MRVLIVARCKQGRFAPFIVEQVRALNELGIDSDFYPVKERGLTGYLNQLRSLIRTIKKCHPDLIHAHYSLCGLLANLQRRVPVVTTYHGSDINNPRVFRLSKIAIWLSRFNIFVSQKNIDKAKVRKRFALIPCGINLDDYPIVEKAEARTALGLPIEKSFVLFAGAFDNAVKNAPLAQAAMALVPEAELIELKGYTRFEVAVLMQAVDCLLMTSFNEGSPQVIKEALACGCPIVSVDVGDVAEIISDIDGCYLAQRDTQDIASKIKQALSKKNRTSGRDRILEKGLDNHIIARKILSVYEKTLDIRKRI